MVQLFFFSALNSLGQKLMFDVQFFSDNEDDENEDEDDEDDLPTIKDVTVI